jgi:hypothetical protein
LSSKNKKAVVFYCPPKIHADLKVRWQYDGLGQSEFFRIMSDLYLNKDSRILEIIEEYKKENKIHNNEKRKKTKKLYERAKQVESKFSLGDEEVESIFDLLEKEHPDL